MELETFALVADVVAGVAVVISLFALASEIKQNNVALARQATQDTFAQFSSARRSLYCDAHARILLDKVREAPDQLTFGDQFAHESLVLEAVFVCSYFHRDIARGMVPSGAWPLAAEWLVRLLDRDHGWEVWASAKLHLDAEFTAAVDRALGDQLTA